MSASNDWSLHRSDSSSSISPSHSDEDLGFTNTELDSISDKEALIEAINAQIVKINQRLPLGQNLMTIFPFKDEQGEFQGPRANFILETGLIQLSGKTELCIERIVQSEKPIVLIPMVLTTKTVGNELRVGYFEHWENHIVGVVVDKVRKVIEYYDSQGKSLKDEHRRLFLLEEAYPQSFARNLRGALIEAEIEQEEALDVSDLGMEDLTVVSSGADWPIYTNTVCHQGYFDYKTCDYRVAHFFQERLNGGTYETLFSKDSPLVGSRFTQRAYVLDQLQTEINRLSVIPA